MQSVIITDTVMVNSDEQYIMTVLSAVISNYYDTSGDDISHFDQFLNNMWCLPKANHHKNDNEAFVPLMA